MVKALFDTNVLIDHLNNLPAARVELGRYSERSISIVTWIEVLVGTTEKNEAATRGFLDNFVVVPLDDGVAARAINLRKHHRMRLPDAIIWASAQSCGALLVTRNAKDFPAADPGVRIPYKA